MTNNFAIRCDVKEFCDKLYGKQVKFLDKIYSCILKGTGKVYNLNASETDCLEYEILDFLEHIITLFIKVGSIRRRNIIDVPRLMMLSYIQ